jgi:glutathione peroxidase
MLMRAWRTSLLAAALVAAGSARADAPGAAAMDDRRGAASVAVADATDRACPELLRHAHVPIRGGPAESLCRYQGKVLLIVNTASQCGYTVQYEGLEALYRRYRDRGLVVIGFPSDDFGGQEPGSNREIAEFCRTIYGIQFPMYEKQSVRSASANPLYGALAQRTGQSPRWNFHKYVVDRSGRNVASFPSDVRPDSAELVRLIERLLAERAPAPRG